MKNKIVVVPELDADTVGLMTWWRLRKETVSHAKIAEVCEAQDFAVPPLPSDEVALKRALHAVCRKRHTMLRTLPDQVYAIVDEEVVSGTDELYDPEYDVRFKAYIEDEEIVFDRADVKPETVDALRDTWEHLRFALNDNDLSKWFCREVDGVQAVRLRESGGVYFVPRSHAPRWREFQELVRSVCTSQVYTVPALHADDAVEAVLDAIVADASQKINDLMAELEEKKLGKRALRSRAAGLESLGEKIKTYEGLLGRKMTALRGQLVDVDGAVVDALMVLEEGE